MGEAPVTEHADDGRTPAGKTWEQVSLSLLQRAFLNRVGFVALVLIAAQTLWRGTSVANGFFAQQDFIVLRDATRDGLSTDYLSAGHAGEFSPFGRLMVLLVELLGGPEWAPVAGVVTGFHLVIGLLLWLVLSLLLPGRRIRLPILAVALFSPLGWNDTLSWVSASIHLPLITCFLVAVLALLLRVREGWAAGGYLAVAAVVLGLATSGRMIAMALALLLLVAALAEPGERTGKQVSLGRRLRTVVAEHRWLWAAIAVAVVLRIVLSVTVGASGTGRVPSQADVVNTCVQFFRHLTVGLVGGPWDGTVRDGILHAEVQWTVGVAVLACVGLLAYIAGTSPRRATALALASLAILLTGLLAWVLLTAGGGREANAVPRAASSAVVPVAVLVAAALRGVTAPARIAAFSGAGLGALTLCLVLCFALSAAITGRALVPTLQNEESRAYVTGLRSGLAADPAIVLLSGPTPPRVIHPWFGADARVSTITTVFAGDPAFDIPSDRLRMVDKQGFLRKVVTEEPVEALTLGDEGCATAVTEVASPLTFSEPLPGGQVVLSFDYLAPENISMRIGHGGETVRVPVRSGLGSVQVPLTGGFTELSVELDEPGNVCLAQVSAGVPDEPTPLG